MPYFFFSRPVLGVVAPLFLVAAGCGGGNGVTVHGTVTYNGQPVEKGYINFHPTDGTGRAAGGEINGGSYTVKNVGLGKCRVEVIATPPAQAADSMDDAIKAAKANKEPSKDLIAANAEGNNQVHEITSSSELNLVLKRSDSSGPPIPKK